MRNGVNLAVPMAADADVLGRALAEDLDAGFVAVFETYRTQVFSVALRVAGRRSDAEDLTAEAFLRAYRALLGYDRDRILELKLRPWLLTIVMNLWRNRLRGQARKPAPDPLDPSEGGGQEGNYEDPGEGVEDAVMRGETGDELASLLALLSEEQRMAVVLRHVVDLPIAEIATVLGVPPGTARSHISRGLQRLRSFTASEEVPDDER